MTEQTQQVQPSPLSGQAVPPWAHLRPTNTKAILAVSLLGIPPAAIVFGVLARREIRRTGEGGWGMATWGMGIGIAVVASYLLFFLAYAGLVAAVLLGTLAAHGGEGVLGSP